MYYKIFQIPLLNFLFRDAKAIPIAAAREDETLLREAFDRIDAELEAGNLVCLFPEGAITRDGEIHEFRGGIDKDRRAPAGAGDSGSAKRGMWGSWFSRKKSGGLKAHSRQIVFAGRCARRTSRWGLRKPTPAHWSCWCERYAVTGFSPDVATVGCSEIGQGF